MDPLLGSVMFKMVSVTASGVLAIGLGLAGCAALDQSKPSAGRHCLGSEGVANQANPANHDWFEYKSFAIQRERLNCAFCA